MPQNNHGHDANDISFSVSDDGKNKKPLCFQYVNPNLLFQWEGEVRGPGQIVGAGTFRVYERSKNPSIKSKLILCLEAQQWKNGKANGQVKSTQTFFFQEKRSDNLVKQVRRFVGKMRNMKKVGEGQYTIERYYSNESKQVTQIRGIWENDILHQGTTSQKGVVRENVKFTHNIENSKLTNGEKEIEKEKVQGKLQNIQKKENKASQIFENGGKQLENQCFVIELDEEEQENLENEENKTNTPNFLSPPPARQRNQKNSK